ncbi:hypothetical protein G7070_11225 [Propioniciclava coleopterorum]|uniref:Type I restriction modification DNA specificity domain-containing protein n=1 Tax=Propioniciclava coleopterorum TaxID=2714937 RepID=A0A6G7Y7H8_9ACTN|nr:restriction endonuclease subunit S [Propioniciclava coleopterorum]QIK72740.1 hypothetical protein G7070_11225 [Propioniciclava coleopterorum]
MSFRELRLSRVARIKLGKMLQTEPASGADIEADYLRAAHVQPNGLILDLGDDQRMWFGPKELLDHDLRADDVVIVEGGAGYGRSALIRTPRPGWGFQNSIVRVRPKPGIADGAFLDYVLQARLFDGSIPLVCSTATIPHFTAEKVAAFPVPVPPLSEQQAIADFLGRETAKIDALIEKQTALIERLRERRDSVWSRLYQAVESDEVPVRRMVSSLVDGPFGSSLTSAHYSEAGVRVIRLGNIGINEFRDEDQAFVSEAYGHQLSAHSALPGDVVMAGLGDERMPLGRAAVVPSGLGSAIVKADCYRLRPIPGVLASYLAWALSAPPVRPQALDLSREQPAHG